mgnify:CR=1 FL=1
MTNMLAADGAEPFAALQMQGRSAALVQLVARRPVYISLYGIAIDRDVAFGVVSPVFALLLFLVQHFLIQQDK